MTEFIYYGFWTMMIVGGVITVSGLLFCVYAAWKA